MGVTFGWVVLAQKTIDQRISLKIIICTIPEPEPETRVFWSNPTRSQKALLVKACSPVKDMGMFSTRTRPDLVKEWLLNFMRICNIKILEYSDQEISA